LPLPETISDYLRAHAQESGDRILQSFPPLTVLSIHLRERLPGFAYVAPINGLGKDERIVPAEAPIRLFAWHDQETVVRKAATAVEIHFLPRKTDGA